VLAVLHDDGIAVLELLLHGERHDSRVARTHRRDERIVGVDDGELGGLQQLFLELCIELERAVAVEMVGRDVQDGRCERRQAVGRLHLEARDLEHVGVGIALEKIKRRRPEVAARGRTQALRHEHLRRQRRHRALAVAARHGDDRRTRSQGEQLDVADHGEPSPSRFDGERQVVWQPR
jgi:hypothetical protein